MNESIAKYIDHTALKADTAADDIMKLCNEAKEYQFASVCVNPHWVRLASDQLVKHKEVKVCTVIGFPLGATTSEVKRFETIDAINNGATEIDMVINIAALKNNDNNFVEQDIRGIVEAAKSKALVKVIIETSLLTNDEIERACKIAVKAGADFVKTSTGFTEGGATVQDIERMRKVVGPNIGVKASGGIRDAEKAQAMIAAGANRIGASAGVAIVEGLKGEGSY